jgi:hypothetical protein
MQLRTFGSVQSEQQVVGAGSRGQTCEPVPFRHEGMSHWERVGPSDGRALLCWRGRCRLARPTMRGTQRR